MGNEECGAKALKEDMKVVSLTQDVWENIHSFH